VKKTTSIIGGIAVSNSQESDSHRRAKLNIRRIPGVELGSGNHFYTTPGIAIRECTNRVWAIRLKRFMIKARTAAAFGLLA
jgi:hypothetical protein